MSVWTLVATDLQGREIGEITNAQGRTLSFALNGVPTCAFKIRLDNPLAGDILTTDVMVKAYEDTTLKGVYDVAAAQEIVEGGARDGIQVTCAGPWSRTTDRLVGKSQAGYSAGPMDRGQILKALLIATNLDDYTGIDVGTIEASATGTVGPWLFKPLSEANSEMASALDGYDWDVTPIEPTTAYAAGPTGTTGMTSPNPSGKATVGRFNTYSVKGYFRQNAIFEYGTGRNNVKGYQRPVDRTKLLNDGYSLPQGFPDVQVSSNIIRDTNPDSIAIRGLHEGVVASDLVVDQLRSSLVEEHVRIRSAPRQLILFESHIEDETTPDRVPRFGVDYDVGDVVTGRAKVNGQVRFDAYFRVYGVDLALSEEGIATPTLRLVTQ